MLYYFFLKKNIAFEIDLKTNKIDIVVNNLIAIKYVSMIIRQIFSLSF